MQVRNWKKSWHGMAAVAAMTLATTAVAGPMNDTTASADINSSAHGNAAVSDPVKDVESAALVLTRMKQQQPELAERLADARGVFIMPEYATAALLVGGSGGEGIMLESHDGEWGNPGFYDVGNIDVGPQAGVAAGSVVMLLMTDEAVERFHSENSFSLTAQAGLTVLNWSAEAPGDTADNDIVVWSDVSGLLAEASLGVDGVRWDSDEANEYYQRNVSADEVLSGDVDDPNEGVLQSEFAEFSTHGTVHGDGDDTDS